MHSVFDQIGIVMVLVAVVSIVMRLLRQPLIIGYILAGLLAGPAVFDIIHEGETFELFSQFGVVLLLFIIGLGLNPKILKETGKVSVTVGIAQVVLITLGGGAVSMLLGLGLTESIVLGMAAAFSSTIIILKLIGDKKGLSRLYGKLAVGILLVQDIVATFALIFVTSGADGGFSVSQLLRLVSFAMLIGGGLTLVNILVLPRLRKFLAANHEMLFVFAVAWAFGIGMLFERAGFSIEVGALIAGVTLANQPYAQEMASRLKPLRDFFLVLFFVQIGSQINMGQIGQVWPLALGLSFIVIIVNPVLLYLMLTFNGYSNKTSFLASSSMAQISEFSIIFMLLAASAGLVSDSSASAITLVAIITITASSYMISFAEKIYDRMEGPLSRIALRKDHIIEPRRATNSHFEVVIFGYQKGGAEFSRLFKKLKKKYNVIDYDPEIIERLGHTPHPHMFGDATDLEFLEEIDLGASKMVISTVSAFEVNKALIDYLKSNQLKATFVCSADTVEDAQQLYDLGASYVMLPHYIGTSQLSQFIEENGYSKTKFKKMRTESTNII